MCSLRWTLRCQARSRSLHNISTCMHACMASKRMDTERSLSNKDAIKVEGSAGSCQAQHHLHTWSEEARADTAIYRKVGQRLVDWDKEARRRELLTDVIMSA